jgi:tetratricopeptide (TPR) repeat protein
MRRTAALCAIVMAALAQNAFAGAEARLTGKVTDAATKAAIAGAKIHLSAMDSHKFESDYTSAADGSYKIFVLDGTIRYKVTVTAPGHTPYEEVVKMKIGDTMAKDFWLGTPAAAAGTAAPAQAAAPKADPSLAAYNDGAKLYNESKFAEAAAKFQEAVTGKPELIAGWEALARSEMKLKAYPKAIEAANKALELAPDETDMNGILADAYAASGDKAKAEENRKKLPVDAATSFNQAAALLNAGKDAEAEPLLKAAIAADEKLAPAYFELGMVDLRAGRMPEAKKNLEKYLQLEPTGKNAATAKETLAYLK